MAASADGRSATQVLARKWRRCIARRARTSAAKDLAVRRSGGVWLRLGAFAPLVVQHAIPGGVAVAALDDVVGLLDALEGEAVGEGGAARRERAHCVLLLTACSDSGGRAISHIAILV